MFAVGGRKGWWEDQCRTDEEDEVLSQDSVEMWTGEGWRPVEWRLDRPRTGYTVPRVIRG